MKNILTILLLLLVTNTVMFAGNASGLKEEKESTKLNLWIPGLFIKMAAEIAEDHADAEDAAAIDLLRKFGTTTICIREGEAYTDKTDKKMTRKLDRMNKQDFAPLLTVNSEGTKVNMSVRDNKKDKIKRMVVLVDEPGDTFVFLKMHCRIDPKDIGAIAHQCAEI